MGKNMEIIIYGTTWCPSCVSAKKFFDEHEIIYKEINIETEGMSRDDLSSLTGGYTVPQIVINGQCIGGFSDLMQLSQSGKLKEILHNG